MGVDIARVAYTAALIDSHAVIRTRVVSKDTELPYLAVSSGNEAMLRYLGEATGTRSIVTRRSFSRAGCAEHCSEKHQHIQSVSGRWSLSGVRATVLLHNVRPYLRLQVDAAREALVAGLQAPFKPAVLGAMAELGWEVPEFAPRPTEANPRPECRLAECTAPATARGLCNRHYHQWRRGTLPGIVGVA